MCLKIICILQLCAVFYIIKYINVANYNDLIIKIRKEKYERWPVTFALSLETFEDLPVGGILLVILSQRPYRSMLSPRSMLHTD